MSVTEITTPVVGELEDPVLSELRWLASRASVEIAPGEVGGDLPLASLYPAGTRVYVPFLPKADYRETVAACATLVACGLVPVPHLPARSVSGSGQLDDWLGSLRGVGVDSLLLVAGDRDRPAGPFDDTLGLLDTGALKDHGFYRIGVAGHPEGHPVADKATLWDALRYKQEYARATGTCMWLVSQFAFDHVRIIRWLEELRHQGTELPVHIGLAGPSSLKSVLFYAARCGVDSSARLLVRRPSAARLLGRWSPAGLVTELARYRQANPRSLLQGIHVFSFGGVSQTSQWLDALRVQRAGPEVTAATGAA